MLPVISIGTQSFEYIRENHCFFVDKSDFIREWWENRDAVTLITRPRRFGKTLNLNMAECFFPMRYAGRQELFEGLSIWKSEKYRGLQGTYPVISLSFANVKGETFRLIRENIINSLAEAYEQHRYLLDSEILTEKEKAYYRSFISYQLELSSDRKMDDSIIMRALFLLSCNSSAGNVI